MTAPRKVDLDRDPVAIAAAGKAVAAFTSRPLASLSPEEMERFERASETVLFAVFAERAARKEALQVPRGKAGIRLAAVDGVLTEAGRRSARARRAARARWSR